MYSFGTFDFAVGAPHGLHGLSAELSLIDDYYFVTVYEGLFPVP